MKQNAGYGLGPRLNTTLASLFLLLLSSGDVFGATTYTDLVNLFIGTASGANGGSGGNAFPGAAVPHAMVKVGIDVDTTPRQAGYIADDSPVTGISLMHDEGTGGNTAGGYGIFPLFPLTNCTFDACPVALDSRKALRAANADKASPGYFTSAFENGIKLEATSTRQAGLIKFTYPADLNGTFVVVDLANDLQRSFEGGNLDIDADSGRVTLKGTYLQSYGTDNYTAFGCYDFTPPSGIGTNQSFVQFGTYQSVSSSNKTNVTIVEDTGTISFAGSSSPLGIEAGALLAFTTPSPVTQRTILARFGVSFISTDQACSNAEAEIPDWDWDIVQNASVAKWEDVLSRIEIDTKKEDVEVVELLYSSLYRSQLVPANLTDENPYWDSPYPFYDALFCSWDTFRTVHPLLSITSPREWAEIVNAYVDGWRNTGEWYIPECRDNTKKGYVQGGSDGMPILGDFAVKYNTRASELGVPTDDLYQALVDTAENTPPDWYMVGRQNTAWKTFGYIPTDWTDPSGSTGLPTREVSRALEYAVGDFAVRQAGIALNKSTSDIAKYENRSMNFLNHWHPNVTSDSFIGFMQRRFPNGTFAFSDPVACSPIDTVGHSCARGTDNNVGFYESSSWEYSFFAPHSMSSIVDLMGGDDAFVNRTTHYFTKGYFLAGNEPSFSMPLAFHYANRPDLSALRMRSVVFDNFNTGIGGIPGNDDSGAMGALLAFHILGLYPVPSSRQLLLNSPLVSGFIIHNDLLGTSTEFTVSGFDPASVSASPPSGAKLYVTNVTVNGQPHESLCWLSFEDVVGGGEIVISVDGDAASAQTRGCGVGEHALPDSLASGGFQR
ncbi:uncharacterized protein FOMMEDRAFT_101848 [Fomitiporia mediterranea MF3/22]|uniref:uncharacterized protein n=1 Tax=Fomitiporia mediterranea (strain MF3/22) TaxID=694068 RepID=UPI00044094E0|nr:uncharacterized protein FOMMEDRAFT_101848 [Fomitiporia mediterranea MF3/22]EJD08450.1 hypothetical protein FOMMEDRAFT_101848 [Fomitiporia mediterranea MF3/22]